jgi:collagen, type I/II/III/V/XI, alpha
MKAYKGFNKDMTCRGFQYEIGKAYETDAADLCRIGFHACENPLDCFSHYAPGKAVQVHALRELGEFGLAPELLYCEVEIEDNGQRSPEDSKVVGKKIKIGAELSTEQICRLHFEYVRSRCDPAKTNAAGDRESASAGERGSASAGDYGSASAGDYGVSASRGSSSAGENGVAAARGKHAKVRGGIGSVLVVCVENEDSYEIAEWKAAVVDGERIRPDTWYTVENGEFKEADW